jgi:hypothetical protein
MSDETVRLLLRIRSSLKKRLAEMAKNEHRSLNGQIEYLLDRAIHEAAEISASITGVKKK